MNVRVMLVGHSLTTSPSRHMFGEKTKYFITKFVVAHPLGFSKQGKVGER